MSADITVTFSEDAAITVDFPEGGVQGPAGPTGATGAQGPQGETGPQGPAGPAQITCETDDTVHALRCIRVSGAATPSGFEYKLVVDQEPI